MSAKNTNTVRWLHSEAMRLSNEARLYSGVTYATGTGLFIPVEPDGEKEEALLKQALEHEERAARTVPYKEGSEPTRSILFRSAATLAYRLGDMDKAAELTMDGLSGWPPPQIKEQLEQVLSSAIGDDLSAEYVEFNIPGHKVEEFIKRREAKKEPKVKK